jgi:hypothetical protein
VKHLKKSSDEGDSGNFFIMGIVKRIMSKSIFHMNESFTKNQQILPNQMQIEL